MSGRGERVLSDSRVEPLCLLDLDDLDYLEAMVGVGRSPVELPKSWKKSDLQRVAFCTCAKDESPVPRRASRVTDAGDKMMTAIKTRLP